MNNLFSQSKVTYKLAFKTFYTHLSIFEQLFEEITLGITSSEVESKTVDKDIWLIEAYFATTPKAIKKIIKDYAKTNDLKIFGSISISQFVDQDWIQVYGQGLKPIEIGRFCISSKLYKEQLPADKEILYIETCSAFGNGEHATTFSCIKALEYLDSLKIYPQTVLDVGCGSGILSFAAERIWPDAQIWGCDIEEAAVGIAQDNAKTNNSKVIFYKNNPELILPSILDSTLDKDRVLFNKVSNNLTFDLLLSNILLGPLEQLASQIKALLNPTGFAILSGFLSYQTPQLIACYEKLGFKIIEEFEKEGWQTLIITSRRF